MSDVSDGAPLQSAKAMLRQTQLFLAASLESSVDSIVFAVDSEYRYLFFNKRCRESIKAFYGRDVDIGVSHLEVVSNDVDRERYRASLSRALAGESLSAVETFGKGAPSRSYEITYKPMRDDADAVIGATVFARNITKRMRAEAALQRSETFLGTALEHLPLIFYVIDSDGIFRHSVGIGLKGLGLEPNQVVGLSVFELYKNHPNILAAVQSALDGNTAQFESHVGDTSHLNYVVPFVDAGGVSEGIVGVALDITDRKRAEIAVAAERERLVVTLRSIGDAVITTDTTGKIVMMNRVAEALTGWSADSAVGRQLKEVFRIVDENTRVPRADPVEAVIRTGGIVELANQTCLLSCDGREMVIAESGAPIRDRESEIVGVVLVFRDITEQKRVAESLQRAQQLESLGVLAGGIAHDFNNLLGGVFGYLDMALDALAKGETEQVRRFLTEAMDVFERARALTLQLLTFAKGGAPIRKPMVLDPFIRKTVQFALSGANVSCNYDIADDLLPCECDENQMGQVIDNLVINAKQAMPKGGVITVSAVNLTLPPERIPVNAVRVERMVRITVRDRGVGMEASVLNRIFEPFFTTKQTGHGLGLAAAFSIMQRHGGWIEAESEPGHGAAFHVYLPATDAEDTDVAGDAPVQYVGAGPVLVMDDEAFIRELMESMLSALGHTAVFAKNAVEAVSAFQKAEASASPFVATILDLTIPGGKGGKAVVTELRNIRQDAVILATSGYSADPVMSDPALYGFTGRIVKPFRKRELSQLLEQHLGAV